MLRMFKFVPDKFIKSSAFGHSAISPEGCDSTTLIVVCVQILQMML
jgi:hypothetical protein